MKTVEYLINHVDELLLKKPFFRGGDITSTNDEGGMDEYINNKIRACLPRMRKNIISQDKFLAEYDPQMHDVLFDANIPSICVKLDNGNFYEVEFKKLAIGLQIRLVEKQTLTLSGNKTIFTMRSKKPTQNDKLNFATIKEYWEDRNMDGWRTKAIYTQKKTGDCGLLFYHNRRSEIKCRLLSYEDGYVIISHNDDNGERLLECVYYRDDNNSECIDCYDDTFIDRKSVV